MLEGLQVQGTRYASNTITLGQLTVASADDASSGTKRARASVALVRKGHSRSRHVAWDPQGAHYTLLRPGIAVANEAEIDAILREGRCHESYFYIHRHHDWRAMERNAFVPVYEASYYCSESNKYVVAQKLHMKQAYGNANRNDAARATTLMTDEVPYWVDRYAKKTHKRARK